jgi:hypothetical protein
MAIDGRTHYEGCWAERGHHDCANLRIAALEAQLKQAKDGWDSCIADLREAGRICKATEDRLKALDWTPITAENLPKVGDEVLSKSGLLVERVNRSEQNEFTFINWINLGWLYRRPINPPPPGGSNV